MWKRYCKSKSIDVSGLAPVSQARSYVEPILKKQKKAELIKMTGSSLEAIATATGSKVEQATDVT
jgi:peptidyl-prolyl cis-trans isomerase D